jgi:hypothetical protein
MSRGFTIARAVAALALVLAAGRWPYLYYQLLRWGVSLTAAYGIYRSHGQARAVWLWIFLALAILFNPLAPIYLARATWSVVDPVAALLLVVSIAGERIGWQQEES